MPITRSNHCAYDTHYHLVLTVKYRKALLRPEVIAIIKTIFIDITDRYDLNFEQTGDDQNHIHLLMSFHPKYSIDEVVHLVKGITARQLFLQLPELKKELWGGEFWSDGYYRGHSRHRRQLDGRRALRQEPRSEYQRLTTALVAVMGIMLPFMPRDSSRGG